MVVPTQLKVLRGNPGKRPIKPEPQPRITEDIPEPPDCLTDDARLEWLRVTPELYRLGLLTVLDLQPLVAYCDAFGRFMTAKRAIALMAAKDPLTRGLMIRTTNGNMIQNPLVGTLNTAANLMVRFASEFGLTPCARTRLSSSGERPPGKFDDLIA
ncbi:MAG TPA: phage terminase small subunit P27 family [Pseudolabrys sp.]|jgi:P27 family predicted phage terminase small subunit|nr:phage terminase small subunit P27 family [Pseudolabrys sp.]